jgi:hypothetical protein
MKHIFLLLIIITCLSGCIEEDFFGLSSFGEIKSIEVSNQASQAVIDTEGKIVKIEIPGGVDLTEITIKTLTISSFATSDKKAGDIIDLTDSTLINITAEDGNLTLWSIKAEVAALNPQLANSDFNAWYKTSDGYYEPGEDPATTIWGTGNPGTKILGLFPTTPLEITDDDLAARMETLYNGNIPAGFGTPISAGSIFTGKFNPDDIDLSNPQAAIDFGTPFAGRPERFKIKYSYVPGAENKDKQGNPLPYGDACDIYILLEVRDVSGNRRLATAWFRSDEIVEEAVTQQVDFVYGELPPDAPDYARPPDGNYVRADSANFILPTHLTFVASSSFDGNNFGGAVGSLLIIDDLELIYEE